jgi:hypothetical protein
MTMTVSSRARTRLCADVAGVLLGASPWISTLPQPGTLPIATLPQPVRPPIATWPQPVSPPIDAHVGYLSIGSADLNVWERQLRVSVGF